jgi:hypothetical protein
MSEQKIWEDWFSATLDIEAGNVTKAETRIKELETLRAQCRQAVLDGNDELLNTLLSTLPSSVSVTKTSTDAKKVRKDTASLLSSSGAVLLAVAALVFTAVAWGSLGVIGQAAVLLSSTVASVYGARRLVRHQRPTTAESLSWLAGAFGAIDVLAISRLGFVEGIPTHLLLASASAGAAFLALITARVAGSELRSPKQLLPIALSFTAVFITFELNNSLRAFLLSVVAYLAVRTHEQYGNVQWLRSAAGLAAAATFSALGAESGAVPLLLGLSTGVLLVGPAKHLNLTKMRSSITAGSLVELAGLFVLFITAARESSAWTDSAPEVLPVGVFVALGVISSRLKSRNSFAFTIPVFGAFIGAHIGETPTLARFSVTAAVVLIALLWRTRQPLVAHGVLAAALPYFAGLNVDLLGGTTTAAFVLTTFAAVTAVHLGVRKKLQDRELQTVTLSAGSVALLALYFASGEPFRFAGILAVLALGAALLALQHRGRGVAVVVSALSAAGCYWSLLPDEVVVEIATLPVATVWTALGFVVLNRTSMRSFPALGPGLLIASFPSALELVVTGDTLLRSTLLVTVGSTVAVVGARLRLSAPILIGVFTALVSALTQIAPWAVGMPRWITLGCAGIALLLAGARFESLRERFNNTGAKLIALR